MPKNVSNFFFLAERDPLHQSRWPWNAVQNILPRLVHDLDICIKLFPLRCCHMINFVSLFCLWDTLIIILISAVKLQLYIIHINKLITNKVAECFTWADFTGLETHNGTHFFHFLDFIRWPKSQLIKKLKITVTHVTCVMICRCFKKYKSADGKLHMVWIK